MTCVFCKETEKKNLCIVLDFWIYKKCHKKESDRVRKNNLRAKNREKIYLIEWLNLLRNNNFSCSCCFSKEQLTIEHIVELSLGGSNTKENITVFCYNCNNRKSKIHDKLFSTNPTRVLEGYYQKRKYKHLFPNILRLTNR